MSGIISDNQGRSSGLVKAAAAAAGGGLLQIKQAVKTDVVTSYSTEAYADVTGMTVDITPTLSTSKILVLFTINIGCFTSGGAGPTVRLVRDTTPICVSTDATTIGASRVNASFSSVWAGIAAGHVQSISHQFIDAPATTSATTYKLQWYTESGYSIALNYASTTNASRLGNSASTITAIELAVGVL